jgi:hypothetical protein
MQSRENLTRMSVMLTFIAARLLPLRCIKKEPSAAGENCAALLGTQSWKLLWLKMDEEATAGEGCFQSIFLQPLYRVACNRKREASCLPHFLALILGGLALKFT